MESNKELIILNDLIDKAISREKEVTEQAELQAKQNEQLAAYMKAQEHIKEELDALWQMAKDYMIENNITEHENDIIKLKLTPSGKYRVKEGVDVNTEIDDSVCVVKKMLDNKKVKSYLALNGELPEGVESTGYVLRKKLKEDE